MANKQEIINHINMVINALNNVDVKGKNNIVNLGNSIVILEDISGILNQEIQKENEEQETTETPTKNKKTS